jgi:hypothetical protein
MRVSVAFSSVCLVCLAFSVAFFWLAADGKSEFAENELAALIRTQRAYLEAVGRNPRSIEEMAPPICDGGACVLIRIPIDPWGRPYQSRLSDGKLVFSSLGKDGVKGTEDDVVSP